MIKNHIARITAEIILIISLLTITGILGTIEGDGKTLIGTMIGVSSTFLFVAQTKASSNTG